MSHISNGWRTVPILQTVASAISPWPTRSVSDSSVIVSLVSLLSSVCLTTCCGTDIFHWRCFNRYAQDHPANTSASGYACPDCNTSVFPPLGSTTPVALQLKNLLSNAEWAKPGLGESFSDRRAVSFSSLSDIPDDETNAIKVVKNNTNHSTAVPVNVNPVSSFIESSEWTTRTTHGNHQNHLENSIHESRLPLLADDVDEDKYKSKPASEFLFRWFRNRRSLMPRSVVTASGPGFRGYLFPGIIAVCVLFTMIHFFLKYGRDSADADNSLNPAFNPNIRIQ